MQVIEQQQQGSGRGCPRQEVHDGGEGGRWILPRSTAVAVVLQFLVGVYGGYFGAGMGIMMLAILDRRMARMSYGQTFLESLPPNARTHRLDDVRAFMRE